MASWSQHRTMRVISHRIHAVAFRLPALGVQILLVSREGGVGIGHVVARDVTVRELTALLADWEAERREKARAQVRTRLLD